MKKGFSVIYIFYAFTINAQNKTDQYINQYKDLAIAEMNIYGIPASITLSQGILESGNGESRLALEGKNHFGIKCHKNWNGKTIIEDDDEKGECFRKYDKVADSYRDHSLFLSERGRYSFLFEFKRTDYKKWARGLKRAGYATNPKYASLLIDLIEKYDLNRFDLDKDMKKQIYLSHSYGMPYLKGVGLYYFLNKSLYYLEINTSFVFSSSSIAYSYEFLDNIYLGANAGIIYLPEEEKDIFPHFSTEVSYKFRKNTSYLLTGGLQFSIQEMEFFGEKIKTIPYLKFTYLID